MKHLKFAVGAALAFSLSQPLMASAIPPPYEPPCVASAEMQSFQRAPAASRKQALKVVLQKSPDAKCAAGLLFPVATAGKDLPTLRQLMLEDDAILVRQNAAQALGWVSADRKATLEALAGNIISENAASVVLARLGSVDMHLRYYNRPDWDSNIRVDGILNSLGFVYNNGSRTAGEQEQIRAAIAGVAANMANQLLQMGHEHRRVQPDVQPVWDRIGAEMLGVMRREPGSDGWVDGWRANALNALDHAITGGAAGFSQEIHTALLLALPAGLSDRHASVRAGSLSLMSALVGKTISQVTPGWHDFMPYLNGEQADTLVDYAAKAMRDPDPAVRKEAVRLLGLLTSRGNGHAAELLAALQDTAAEVREQAARALALRPAMPAEVAPLLAALAQRRGEESPAAIAALSQDRRQAVAMTLLDVLAEAASAPGDELQEKRATAAARALGKFGLPVVLPLLGKVGGATTAPVQDRLYGVLSNVGWTRLTDPAAVEAALMPTLTGPDESARLFAVNLLALTPQKDTHRFAPAMVEALFDRYLRDVPRRLSAEDANPATVWLGAGSGEGWRMPPEVAVAIIAGGSTSPLVAQRMVSWLCAPHRLELGQPGDGLIATWGGSPLSNEMDASKEMARSLARMGPVAEPFVRKALVAPATRLCKDYLEGVSAASLEGTR